MTQDPVAQELRWYLQRDYEGELGVRSSLALQVETLQRGGHSRSPTKPDIQDEIIGLPWRGSKC